MSDRDPKLRFKSLDSPVSVVLVEPEIPQNTGSIARTCAATGSCLHLVGKLGFSIQEHAVKRAGLDYWDRVNVFKHENFDNFLKECSPETVLLFSSRAQKPYTEAPYARGCFLVFGKETAGLGQPILDRFPEAIYGIPTLEGIRSLNLSNAVSVVVYECLRKMGVLKTFYRG